MTSSPKKLTRKNTRTEKYTIYHEINYKNINLLRRYIGITGKIFPRHVTKLTAKEQRTLAKTIRQARNIGFLPFVWTTY
jgi:ribosomal protein S18